MYWYASYECTGMHTVNALDCVDDNIYRPFYSGVALLVLFFYWQVTGMVQDKAGLKLFKVAGTWDASISYSEVLPTGGQQKALQFGEPKLIWEARPVP